MNVGKNQFFLLGAALTIISSCAHTPAILSRSVPPTTPVDIRVEHIKYVGEMRNIYQAGGKRHPALMFFEKLAGIEPALFSRPLCTWASGRYLALTEPSKRSVTLIDRNSGKVIVHGGFIWPLDVALLGNRVFVSDPEAGLVFAFNLSLELTGSLGFPLKRPSGLCASEALSRLYVVDSWDHKIRAYNRNLQKIMEIGGRGKEQGKFNFPTFCAVSSMGELYVVDSMNFRIQRFDGLTGAFKGAFGCHGNVSGCFAQPKGVAVDSDGHIYVVDSLFDSVQVFDSRGTLLAVIGKRGRGPGEFWLPSDIHIDERDIMYVVDTYNDRIQVFKYESIVKRAEKGKGE